MLLIAGIDPGLRGAIAVYDFESDKVVALWDIPAYAIVVGGKTRRELDVTELRAIFDVIKIMGVRLIGIERVQGYGGKGQSASAAFTFGNVYGTIRTLAESTTQIAGASPAVWKLSDKVSNHPEAIVKKAEIEFPEWAHMFRGAKGGPLHDRAESAFLSRYFARRIWPTMQPRESLRARGDLALLDAAIAGTADVAPLAKPVRKSRKHTPV